MRKLVSDFESEVVAFILSSEVSKISDLFSVHFQGFSQNFSVTETYHWGHISFDQSKLMLLYGHSLLSVDTALSLSSWLSRSYHS